MNTPHSNQSTGFDEALVKVFVNLEPADWHRYRTESLWAEPLGNNLYRIRNVPFYAMGVSNEDIVRADLKNDNLFLQRVDTRGGHSTYRFFTMEGISDEQWIPYWEPLEKLGCTYERGTARLFAVDVPPQVDIYKAYELLDLGEKAGVWGFQEGHCGHVISGASGALAE
ncbi:MAG: DUF4265 domain-containing protein [Acidobacteriaceae bacterium]|nr:DUF4265 domain-containing protein [Acidobacteriaceae bacterium]MBV9779936.1 DUF4265 domain-containing protein [Acidobacteriaceae bacterium]